MIGLYRFPEKARTRRASLTFMLLLTALLLVALFFSIVLDHLSFTLALSIAFFIAAFAALALLWGLERRAVQLAGSYDRVVYRIESALNAQSIGVLLIDHEDQVFWWNDAARRLLRLNVRTHKEQNILKVIQDESFHRYYISGEYVSVLEMPMENNLGIYKWLEVEVAPYDASGKMLVIRDITGLKRLEVMRSDFASNVAHQLKTPLSVIQGYSDIMLQYVEADSVPPMKVVNKVVNQVNRMNELIRDMLVLSRIETGRANLIMSEVHMIDLMRELHDETKKLLDIKDQKLKLSIDADVEDHINGNTGLLRTAFTQLIENASKYSPKGSKIRMSWSKDHRGLVLSVTDSGIGIDPSFIPRLTERFYRVEGDSSAPKGSGLGLAIVKHVMSLHGAQLHIESEQGNGSTFACIFESQKEGITLEALSRGLGHLFAKDSRFLR